MKKITLLSMLFIFAICFNSYAQFSEGFETDIPVSWTVINNGSTNGWVQNAAPSGGAQEGSAVASITYGGAAHDDYLITPQISVTAGVNDRFSYYIKSRSSAFLEPYEVLLSTTDALSGSFTTTVQSSIDAPNAWTEDSFDLTDYVGQSIYIAIHATGTNEWELYVDNVTNDAQPTNTADWNNLQWPLSGSITTGDAFEVYSQIWEDGVTDGAGQGTGIEAWLGYNAADTDPSTGGWTWILSPYFGESGNNDEFLTDIGSGLSEGTYYYASRFRVEGGPYTYGGAGGFWSSDSGTLTVTDPPPPANDVCSGAIALTPGNIFTDNPIVGSNSSTSDSGETAPGCASYSGGDLWYSVVVPSDGNITLEMDSNPTGSGGDAGGAAYSGSCGTLVLISCSDDDGPGLYPQVVVSDIGLAGQTIYFRVWEYGNNATIDFQVSAYSASLSVEDNIIEGFKMFPNPVNDVLRFRALDNIEDIRIYNLLGQEVLRAQPNVSNTQIDMIDLPSGMYVVKVQVGEQLGAYRIVKE